MRAKLHASLLANDYCLFLLAKGNSEAVQDIYSGLKELKKQNEELINKRYRYADPCLVYEVVWNSVYREDSNTYGQDPYSKYDYTFVTGHVPIQYARRELPADQVTKESYQLILPEDIPETE